jgi:predicted O-linked N-acetylglucosamine transferase (SPINDLY family)
VTYLGYPASTGLAAIDYRLTDAVADPAGAEADYREALVRLPRPFLAYRPPGAAPPLPARAPIAPGEATFVSFNELLKVSDPVVEAWAAILERLPRARLLLKGSALADTGTAERFAARLAARGIARDRLRLEGRTPGVAEHLARYRDAHIGLDTFPYNGTTTTCEALWMGVPVVTLRGERHAGRVGASLLEAIGLGSLVAEDAAAYVEGAVALAEDPARLAELGATMRERLGASPHLDSESLARAIEDAYRDGWRRWCAARGAAA